MRVSSWLNSASAAIICGAALANAEVQQKPFAVLGRPDFSGAKDAVVSAATKLGRPEFQEQLAQDGAKLQHSLEEALDDLKHLVLDHSTEVKHKVSQHKHKLEEQFADAVKEASNAVDALKGIGSELVNAGRVWVDGHEFDKFIHKAFPTYALRLNTKKETVLCGSDVIKHTGYLDISDSRHLWFTYFESRNDPAKDPLVLWLNGGPGCSSSTGLLFELGPCLIADGGNSVKYNKYSWNSNANLIFLDQPVEVGYSYSDDGNSVNNSQDSAADVYAFLQLFFQKFPDLSKKDFHVAAESYGGHYAPNIASVIHKNNQAIKSNDVSSAAAVHINLASVLIGNGLTEPYTQFASVYDFACSPENKFRLFDPESSTCIGLKQKAKTCQGLIGQCQKYNSQLVCTPATLYCWGSMYGDAQNSGKNLYDVRRTCDRAEDKDGPLCYKQMEWIDVFMNKPETKKMFGAPASREFQSCNMEINRAFQMHGDSVHNSAALIPPMVEDGIRFLIYAGETDYMCNWIGNERWSLGLETPYQKDLNKSGNSTWYANGTAAGTVTSAGKGGFGNFAFVRVFESGHMVPTDQPAASLELLNAWLANKALDTKKPSKKH
ncbi:hypothetical protein OC842_002904 [Tilletia horrida]|uniref:Carboxypeptidase n=1 Tax=Tilletia horrida TaxID=155126 RepID=A0AAN6JL81_9BASI|nr:hypothetical protein OC842_002904 [Tilletia horrida]